MKGSQEGALEDELYDLVKVILSGPESGSFISLYIGANKALVFKLLSFFFLIATAVIFAKVTLMGELFGFLEFLAYLIRPSMVVLYVIATCICVPLYLFGHGDQFQSMFVLSIVEKLCLEFLKRILI